VTTLSPSSADCLEMLGALNTRPGLQWDSLKRKYKKKKDFEFTLCALISAHFIC
jgi:hypothetical protein